MRKIRLTKNELKRQKDNLKRFTRYLPTLELKKKQLLQEIRKMQNEIDRLMEEFKRSEQELDLWVDVFAEEIDLEPYVRIAGILREPENVAGIDIAVLKDIRFEENEVDFFNTPLWVDTAIDVSRSQIMLKTRREFIEEQIELLKNELRVTIQRIKLFEEVKIPEARENIRVIQIFLGDQQTAEVVRGKIAKSKIEKKKLKQRAVA